MNFLDTNRQIRPLDAIVSFARQMVVTRPATQTQMASAVASPFAGAANVPAASPYGGMPGQQHGLFATPPVQAPTGYIPVMALPVPNLANPSFGTPTLSLPPTYGGMPGQQYWLGATAQVQHHGYAPLLTGHINTQAPQGLGGNAPTAPYARQEFRPAEAQHPTQPTRPGSLSQVQAPTGPGQVDARAGFEAVKRNMAPSTQIMRYGQGVGDLSGSDHPNNDPSDDRLDASVKMMNAGLTSDEESPATTASSIAQPIEATRSATPCASESASPLIPPASPASQLAEVPQASSSKQVFDTYATRHIKSSPDDMWPDDMASNLNLSQQINRHHRMWLGLWKDPDVPSFFVSLRDICVPMPAGFEF